MTTGGTLPGPPTSDPRSDGDPAPPADGGSDPATVADAWRAMVALVPVSNPEATTPAEYARRAVAVGLPAGPVNRLTALFREVRYGGRADSAPRANAARRALDALRGGED